MHIQRTSGNEQKEPRQNEEDHWPQELYPLKVGRSAVFVVVALTLLLPDPLLLPLPDTLPVLFPLALAPVPVAEEPEEEEKMEDVDDWAWTPIKSRRRSGILSDKNIAD